MTTRGLGVLPADTEIAGMTETAMEPHLLHPLQVLPSLGVQVVGQELRVGPILDVLLTVEKVLGDVVLQGILHDRDDALQLLPAQLTGTLAQINLGALANDAREATTNTRDGSQGILNLLLAIDVGVQNTEDVLKARSIGNDDRLNGWI